MEKVEEANKENPLQIMARSAFGLGKNAEKEKVTLNEKQENILTMLQQGRRSSGPNGVRLNNVERKQLQQMSDGDYYQSLLSQMRCGDFFRTMAYAHKVEELNGNRIAYQERIPVYKTGIVAVALRFDRMERSPLAYDPNFMSKCNGTDAYNGDICELWCPKLNNNSGGPPRGQRDFNRDGKSNSFRCSCSFNPEDPTEQVCYWRPIENQWKRRFSCDPKRNMNKIATSRFRLISWWNVDQRKNEHLWREGLRMYRSVMPEQAVLTTTTEALTSVATTIAVTEPVTYNRPEKISSNPPRFSNPATIQKTNTPGDSSKQTSSQTILNNQVPTTDENQDSEQTTIGFINSFRDLNNIDPRPLTFNHYFQEKENHDTFANLAGVYPNQDNLVDLLDNDNQYQIILDKMRTLENMANDKNLEMTGIQKFEHQKFRKITHLAELISYYQSRSSNQNQIKSFENFYKYGCYCLNDGNKNDGDLHRGSGASQDPIDQACREHDMCVKCAKIDNNDKCHPYRGYQFSITENSNNNNKIEHRCLDLPEQGEAIGSANNCRYALCQCDKALVEKLVEFSDVYNPSKHITFTNRETECQMNCKIDSNTGKCIKYDACCGENVSKRKPFASDNGRRKCCKSRIYDSEVDTCEL